jgi:hypothetical protein
LLVFRPMPHATTTSSNDEQPHDAPRAERVTRGAVVAREPAPKDPQRSEALDVDGQDPYDNIACTD